MALTHLLVGLVFVKCDIVVLAKNYKTLQDISRKLNFMETQPFVEILLCGKQSNLILIKEAMSI